MATRKKPATAAETPDAEVPAEIGGTAEAEVIEDNDDEIAASVEERDAELDGPAPTTETLITITLTVPEAQHVKFSIDDHNNEHKLTLGRVQEQLLSASEKLGTALAAADA